MSYDAWKTRSPDDLIEQRPPCEEMPAFDIDTDVCAWCGARPEQDCGWSNR